MASSSSGALLWRTAFLTLRDEHLNSPTPTALHSLIRDLVLSQSTEDLAAAATELPPHEVTSDAIKLAELAVAISECSDADQSLLRICHLIHDVSCKVRMEINSSSWNTMLNFIRMMVECKSGDAATHFCMGKTSGMKAIAEIIETIRIFDKAYRRNSSLSECTQQAEILLAIVSCLHSELLSVYHSPGNHWSDASTGTRKPKCISIWEMQTTAFSMITDTLSRIGSCISKNLWQSLVEVLRKVMDFIGSKNLLMVDNIMSRFYTTLFHCLHLVLTDPKDSLSGQVTGFGATLQVFLTYGLSSRSSVPVIPDRKDKGVNSPNQKPLLECKKARTYIPPHLRKSDMTTWQHSNAPGSSDFDCSQYGLSSSDSDLSDNDCYAVNGDPYRSSKTRVAAIVCIQDLCQAEPKSLTSLWTLLLPETDVLQPRRYPATLMTCLIFDPVMKIRVASASALASMLDGHSSIFLQVAEHKGSIKCGSFTTLSSSLGQILMQLHTGVIYLIRHETNNDLLVSLFKVLVLLISATPYARMPGNLLPTLIATLCASIKEDLICNIAHSGILGIALSCLGAALSVSPPSSHVQKMLEEDISRGVAQNQQESSVFFQLIQFSEEGPHWTARIEALQVLRAVSHNYPGTVTLLWENISATVYRLLKLPIHDDDSNYELRSGSWRGDTGKTVGPTSEKCIVAAVKALDVCLRAASGYKGADDLECRLADIQLISDSTRRKKISSAPSYDLEEVSGSCFRDCYSGSKQWSEVIEKHLCLALPHRSSMVRAAAVTCFAGMTSDVFFALSKEKQEFVISCAVNAALNDGVSSVRSAACRAIGVITYFPEIICCTTALKEFIRAVDNNSHDYSSSVRITACWALANICHSLCRQATNLQLERSKGIEYDLESISPLFESSLRLTKDGDKIKSNAVRALGNLSRFINFTCHSTTSNDLKGMSNSYHCTTNTDFPKDTVSRTSDVLAYTSPTSKSTLCPESGWLERIVNAFISCVTTGNVKVQWNVCHALSNLFMNDTIKLHDMSWAPSVYSILLLLLRDATNYKIRINAAVALAVPASRLDYGNSFCDVVQGLVHVLESLNLVPPSSPSSFKYKDDLEKQLMLTTSHVLGFASSNDDQALKDFLIKKASFLEGWFRSLCSTYNMHLDQPSTSEHVHVENLDDITVYNVPNKTIASKVSRSIKSLLHIYECSNNQILVRRFEKLASNFP